MTRFQTGGGAVDDGYGYIAMHPVAPFVLPLTAGFAARLGEAPSRVRAA